MIKSFIELRINSMFNIICDDFSFKSEWDDIVVQAKIVIDSFSEDFFIPVTFWSIEEYKKEWIISLEEGLSKKKHSVLITSMYEPDKLNFIQSWVIYYEANKAYIQNKIFFTDDYINFNYKNINGFVEKRIQYSEFGDKISEWETDVCSIVKFYRTLKTDFTSYIGENL